MFEIDCLIGLAQDKAASSIIAIDARQLDRKT
jgi:hypothetical protein